LLFHHPVKDHIVMYWRDDAGEHRQAVRSGEAMLFGMPEDGGRQTEEDSSYECQWMRLIGAGLRIHWLWLRERFGRVVTIDPDGETAAQANEITEDFERGEAIPARSVHRFVCLLTEELTLEQERRLPPAATAIERIRNNPFRPWSLKTLATKVGCTREHLTRLFTDTVGQPPASWLRNQRLERAIRLVETTDIPMAEVARLSGFGSADTLGRLLRSQCGTSGSTLRERAKKRLAQGP
jgi:AraC-like DNA-binding protein